MISKYFWHSHSVRLNLPVVEAIHHNLKSLLQVWRIWFTEFSIFEFSVHASICTFQWLYNVYLLLTKFQSCTVSYRLSFFPLIYNPSAKCIGYKTKGKNQGSVIYSMDWEDEVRMIFITSLLCVWRIWGTISIHTKGLKISEAPWKQSKSIWNCCETLKSLASFDTQSQE